MKLWKKVVLSVLAIAFCLLSVGGIIAQSMATNSQFPSSEPKVTLRVDGSKEVAFAIEAKEDEVRSFKVFGSLHDLVDRIGYDDGSEILVIHPDEYNCYSRVVIMNSSNNVFKFFQVLNTRVFLDWELIETEDYIEVKVCPPDSD